MLRVLRSHQARPLGDLTETIFHAPISTLPQASSIWTACVGWLRTDQCQPKAVASDAQILTEYLTSFLAFFGNAKGAVEVYWAFLVWLFAAPAAPYSPAAVPVGIDPWVYPVYAVLFGRSSGGKTLFTRIAARSMFGFES